jgi:hypothetical protein
MSSFRGPTSAGKRSRSAARTSAVSSTERVCHVRDALGIGYLDDARLCERLDEHDRTGRLAGRADDLVVACMADEDHAVAGVGEATHLNMHLRHERTCRVDRSEISVGSFAMDIGRDAVR